MSKTTKKNKALVLSSVQQTFTNTSASNRFMELVKVCDIEAEVMDTIPTLDVAKQYDCILVDLKHIPLRVCMDEQVLALTACSELVLFNACEQQTCESSALFSGVKGIFYHDDRPDLILKGLESIMQHESWFKRSTMNKAVIDLLKLKQAQQKKTLDVKEQIALPQLTKREQTIVHLVSSGAQNKEIAEQLHISPNTVKTHIYSLFRKTSSRNRVELITWSQQFHSPQLLNS